MTKPLLDPRLASIAKVAPSTPGSVWADLLGHRIWTLTLSATRPVSAEGQRAPDCANDLRTGRRSHAPNPAD